MKKTVSITFSFLFTFQLLLSQNVSNFALNDSLYAFKLKQESTGIWMTVFNGSKDSTTLGPLSDSIENDLFARQMSLKMGTAFDESLLDDSAGIDWEPVYLLYEQAVKHLAKKAPKTSKQIADSIYSVFSQKERPSAGYIRLLPACSLFYAQSVYEFDGKSYLEKNAVEAALEAATAIANDYESKLPGLKTESDNRITALSHQKDDSTAFLNALQTEKISTAAQIMLLKKDSLDLKKKLQLVIERKAALIKARAGAAAQIKLKEDSIVNLRENIKKNSEAIRAVEKKQLETTIANRRLIISLEKTARELRNEKMHNDSLKSWKKPVLPTSADICRKDFATPVSGAVFKPLTAKVEYRDHMIDLVHVEGKTYSVKEPVSKQKKTGTPQKLYLLENDYSFSVTRPNNYISRFGNKCNHNIRLYFLGADSIRYFIQISDVLEHVTDGSGNYSDRIGDQSVFLTEKEPQDTLFKNTSFEYLSAILFTDIFGLNSQTPNSLIQTQGLFDFPLNLHNARRIIFFPSGSLQLNLSKIDGSNRILNASRAFRPGDTDSVSFVNMFDLVRYNNANFSIRMGLFTYEIAKLNLRLGYDFGYRVMCTNVSMNNPVNATERISPGIYTSTPDHVFKLMYRPDSDFGMDAFVVFNHLRQKYYAGLKESFGQVGLYPEESKLLAEEGAMKKFAGLHFYERRMMWLFEFNFYTYTNKQKKQGGIFIKSSNYYLPSTRNIYPMFLFGYSTDVRRLIK